MSLNTHSLSLAGGAGCLYKLLLTNLSQLIEATTNLSYYYQLISGAFHVTNKRDGRDSNTLEFEVTTILKLLRTNLSQLI